MNEPLVDDDTVPAPTPPEPGLPRIVSWESLPLPEPREAAESLAEAVERALAADDSEELRADADADAELYERLEAAARELLEDYEQVMDHLDIHATPAQRQLADVLYDLDRKKSQ